MTSVDPGLTDVSGSPIRGSFGQQARWNTGLSAAGQLVSVAFITVASRLLGRENFGHYVWITALPGLFVIFDLFLGQSLQNRLTELHAVGKKAEADFLVWSFMWGMLAAALAFAALALVVGVLLGALHVSAIGAVPLRILWLGLLYLICFAFSVPLLAAHLAYNAQGAIHKNAAVSFFGDLTTRTVFLLVLFGTGSLASSIVAYSVSLVLVQVGITARFLRLYRVDYHAPSPSVVRAGFRELWRRGNARDWALTRVVDAVYKNSEIVIGTLVVGPATIGDFALLDRLSNALMLAANSIYVPLVPALVSARATEQTHRMARLSAHALRYSLIGLLGFTAFYLLLGQRLASLWAGRSIHFPLLIVVLICMRAWTRVLSSLGWHLLAGHQRIRLLFHATAISGMIYLVLYATTLTRYGVASIVGSQIVAQIVFIGIAQRYRSSTIDVAKPMTQPA